MCEKSSASIAILFIKVESTIVKRSATRLSNSEYAPRIVVETAITALQLTITCITFVTDVART